MGSIRKQIKDTVLQTGTRSHVGNGIPAAGEGSGNVTTSIDSNHPLFLLPADVRGIQIISF